MACRVRSLCFENAYNIVLSSILSRVHFSIHQSILLLHQPKPSYLTVNRFVAYFSMCVVLFLSLCRSTPSCFRQLILPTFVLFQRKRVAVLGLYILERSRCPSQHCQRASIIGERVSPPQSSACSCHAIPSPLRSGRDHTLRILYLSIRLFLG